MLLYSSEYFIIFPAVYKTKDKRKKIYEDEMFFCVDLILV
jgi:hypothetical protein